MEFSWSWNVVDYGVGTWRTGPGGSVAVWPTLAARILSGQYTGFWLLNHKAGPGRAVAYANPILGTLEVGQVLPPSGGGPNFPYGFDVEPNVPV